MAIYQEELKQQSSSQQGLVERLRTEKKVLLHKIHEEGYELGVRSASNLSYKNFQHFERVAPLVESLDEDVLDYLWTFLDNHGYPKQARSLDPDFAHLLEISPQTRILFTQGWLAGVLSVWQMIKEQVEGDR